MTRIRKFTTRLAVEVLEPRWLLAGNVTAQAVPNPIDGSVNAVIIEGDSAANEIRIIEDAPGHVRIEGLDTTTINGQAADEVFTCGTIVWVEVRLGNGSDTVIHEFTGDQFRHSTTIDTGNGDDSVFVFAQGIVGRLKIDTGMGNDSVTLNLAADSSLLYGFHLITGAGDDTVLFRANSGDGWPTVEELSFIETEEGNDVVRFEGTFGVVEALYVALGAGDDTLIGDSGEEDSPTRISASGGPGHDTVIDAAYFNPYRLSLFETFD